MWSGAILLDRVHNDTNVVNLSFNCVVNGGEGGGE